MSDYIEVEPSVARHDQNHAAALDLLRHSSDFYVLIVPGDGEMLVAASGDGMFLATALLALKSSAEEAVLAMLDDEEEVA